MPIRKPLLKRVLPFLLALASASSLFADFAPDTFRGRILYSTVVTATGPFSVVVGTTTINLFDRTTDKVTGFSDEGDLITTSAATYTKTSANVGKLRAWVPALGEYSTTYYTFTDYDEGTVHSSVSIGTITGTFKLHTIWDWDDQSAYWDQAVSAQNEYILQNPSALGLYTSQQLEQAKQDAAANLFTQADIDAAVAAATSDLYSQAELDAAVATAASQSKIYLKTTEDWELLAKTVPTFTLAVQSSSDLQTWQTVAEAEIDLSTPSANQLVKVEVK